jgi:SAM-dependent methyltransferase
VERTAWKQGSSTWSEYSGRDHYDSGDLAVKERFVETTLVRAPVHTVLDVGCNDGRFSDIAAHHATTVVAMDADHLAVDRLYRRLRDTGPANVLPLVVDVLNPTGASGWLGRERAGFFDRVRFDLVLLLAVVHHLAISGGVPLEELGAWMRSLACPLVVEFPDENDDKVRQLLEHTKSGRTWEYSLACFERALHDNGLTVRRRESLPSGTRTMFEISPE